MWLREYGHEECDYVGVCPAKTQIYEHQKREREREKKDSM